MPVTGIVDTGSDISVMSGDLFKMIVGIAELKEEDFKPANKRAFNYNKQPIALDGQMEVSIGFEDKEICTTVYVKIKAPDSLLLSETVCRELGIVQYHPNVRPLGNSRETGTVDRSPRDKVRMIQSVCLPLHHTAVMPVEIAGHRGTVLLESSANLQYCSNATSHLLDSSIMRG